MEVEELGESLYKKVEEILKTAKKNDSHTVSAVTGMLLERPSNEINLLLDDVASLKSSVQMALHSLLDNGRVENEAENISNQQDNTGLSKPCAQEEAGDVIYAKASSIDPQLAPYITGMILELDHNILAELLNNEYQLLQAVEKARSSFLIANRMESLTTAHTPSLLPNSLSTHPSSPTSIQGPLNNRYSSIQRKDTVSERVAKEYDSRVGEYCDAQKQEEFGPIIFQRAEILYNEYAAEISGMILEMDYLSLEKLVADPNLLDEAISKARSALSSQSRCNAF